MYHMLTLTPFTCDLNCIVQHTLAPIDQYPPIGSSNKALIVVTVAFFPIVLRASVKGDIKTN